MSIDFTFSEGVRPIAEPARAAEPDLALWLGVDKLVAPIRSLHDLRAHRLHLLAAHRWRALGLEVPEDLIAEERLTSYYHLAADAVLQRVFEHLDGPVLLFKGPEVAAHYPQPTTRPFADIDIVSPNAERAHRALVAGGFRPVGEPEEYYHGLHHVQPLSWPTLPVAVELHHHPNWVEWSPPPPLSELLADARAAHVGPPGMMTLSPLKHAVVLAVNSWSDAPLRRVLDLVDIAAVLEGADAADAQDIANEWNVGRIWKATSDAIDHLLYGEPLPTSMRIWGRAAASVRDVTVTENHFRRLASLFWALPPWQAIRFLPRALAGEFLPSDNERWGPKLMRMAAALRNPFRARSQHDQMLGGDAHRLSHRARKGPGRDEASES